MIFPRMVRATLRVSSGLCVAALVLFAAPSAFAQGKLDAHYEATLAGISVGKGAWSIDISDDQFSAAASGGTSGLLKAFAGGSGSGASQGRVVNGALVATNYSASTTTSKKTEAIRIVLSNGNVKEYPLSPEACRTGASVFDGRMRYDLKLDFKRMETVKAEKGYRGPVVVCAIYFSPIAGYIPDRPVIKYLAAQRNIEIAFAPVAGTRILVPFRIVIPTPLGTAMLEATQFITQASPPRVAKTQ